MMKIAFIVRSSFYLSPGGDTIQAEYTAKYLRKLDIEVDIKLTSEQINYSSYQLLHFFNIIRPADILPHIRKGLPYVISSIYVDYAFYKTHQSGFLYQSILKYFSPDNLEYTKTIGRWLVNGSERPPIKYLLNGHRKSIVHLLKNAEFILPNSFSELARINEKFGSMAQMEIIPNGIDLEMFRPDNSIPRISNQVISVGRIETRKNQLNLIRALNNSSYELIIIGKPSPNHQKYYKVCKSEAKGNIHFIKEMPQSDLHYHYASAKVHALPSFFETTGLSSLEAAYLGCNIVITDKGDTTEYFGTHGFYCVPDDPDSIYDAVDRAASMPFNNSFQLQISNHYTWNKAALLTKNVYQKILAQ